MGYYNQNLLVLEQAEGYVKALEKSTSWVLSWREVFERRERNDYPWEKG
jgi:predicted  nucleic acid-binding Zn-ribbon protein